jgi:hypothetical protein
MIFKNKIAQDVLDHLQTLANLMFSADDAEEAKYRAYAVAVETAARIELETVPNVVMWKAATPGLTAMPLGVIDPIKLKLLSRAVNQYCSCGGGAPDDCCDVCKVWHFVDQQQNHMEPGSSDAQGKQKS